MQRPKLDFIFFLAVALLSVISLIYSATVHYEKQKAIIKIIEVVKTEEVEKVVPEKTLAEDCVKKGGRYYAYTASWNDNKFVSSCDISITTYYQK
jgi:hypothetical protein